MAAKAKLTKDQISAAHERVARGETKASIAAEYGVTDASLGAAMKRHPRVQAMPPARHAPPAQDTDADNDPDEEPVTHPVLESDMSPEEQRSRLSSEIRELQEQRSTLVSQGEIAEARKLAPVLIQAHRALASLSKKNDPDTLSVSRAEIADAGKEGKAALSAYAASREMRCCDCHRKLSIKWGLGE